MGTEARINVQEVMAEIRRKADLRREQAASAPSAAEPQSRLYDLSRLSSEIAASEAFCNEFGTINPRPAGITNDLIQSFKKLIRRVLGWYARPLSCFNSAVLNSLNEIARALQDLQETTIAGKRQQAIDREMTQGVCDNLQSGIEALRGELQSSVEALRRELQSSVEALRCELLSGSGDVNLRDLEARLRLSERTLRRLVHAPEINSASAVQQSPIPSMFPVEMKSEADFDYFMFEEHFRGPENLIKERQSEFLRYFLNRENIVDLGCGRGEFLELLREKGISAKGVELGTDAYLLCREKGLDVVQQDLFLFLESLPDGSLGGIFCSQVIEHLPAGLQIRLVMLARQKLSAGAPLIIETINPECLYALSRNFFLDPTHVRPVHPEMLTFLMQSLKFEDVELKFSSPAPGNSMPELTSPESLQDLKELNKTLARVNSAVFGFQDYAVIGFR